MVALNFPMFTVEDRVSRINAALKKEPVYVNRSDGLNHDRISGARQKSGSVQVETPKGWVFTGATPFFGRSQKSIW